VEKNAPEWHLCSDRSILLDSKMCAMSLGVRLETFRGGGGATGERLVRLTFRGQYSEVTVSQTNPLEGVERSRERGWSGLPLEVSTLRSEVVRLTL
jgi:hypothetical protein